MTDSLANSLPSLGHAAARAAMLLGLLLLPACAAQGPQQTETVFYPPLPQQPRIQFLTVINTEKDIGGGSSEFQDFLLGRTLEGGVLQRPFDVAHGKRKLYVVDKTYKTVVIIDLATGKFDTIKDTKGGGLENPMSVFVSNGYTYIADKGRKQIVVYNERNEFYRAYGQEDQFDPVDVVVDGDRIYVSDVQDSEVEVLDRATGKVIMKIGELGEEEGQFHWPTHLTLDGEGSLYVTDFLNFRVQKFDRAGNFVKSIGELGTFPGAMPRPKGLAVDGEGYLYAVDSAFELVQIFDTKSAEVLLGFGKFQTGPGSSWLPVGIDIDYDNVAYFARYADPNFRPKYLIYVVNQSGPSKLNVYAFGDWTGPLPEVATPTAKPAEDGTEVTEDEES